MSLAAIARAEEPLDTPVLSGMRWVVPSPGLPPDLKVLHSNNNVAIVMHEGRLYMAWRSAKIHFATKTCRMYIVSSGDMGDHWQLEREVKVGTDLREPMLLSMNGRLIFYFFQAGTNPLRFEPQHVWRMTMLAPGVWSDPDLGGDDGEILWEMKVRNGQAWRTSYIGNHYQVSGASSIDVRFSVSVDGISWRP
jgi:hypothetical protein